ncbi:hypothetical protein NKH77_31640 [Streptomyces sp. M19]
MHDAEPVTARVAAGCWVPQLADQRGDVALLELARPQASEHVAPLYRLPPLPGRRVRMYGFPSTSNTACTSGRPSPGPAAALRVGAAVPADGGGHGAARLQRRGRRGHRDRAGHRDGGRPVRRPGRLPHPDAVPADQRLHLSYMIPVETLVRHLPRVAEWAGGDRGVDLSFVSDGGGPADRRDPVPDPEFARWLARWLGRDGLPDVEVTVIGPAASARSRTLGRAVALADRELSAEAGGAGRDLAESSGAPPDTVPPVGSLDLALDVTGRTVAEVAKRVADRMHLLGHHEPDGPFDLGGHSASLFRADAVPLTIVVEGVDYAADPPGSSPSSPGSPSGAAGCCWCSGARRRAA